MKFLLLSKLSFLIYRILIPFNHRLFNFKRTFIFTIISLIASIVLNFTFKSENLFNSLKKFSKDAEDSDEKSQKIFKMLFARKFPKSILCVLCRTFKHGSQLVGTIRYDFIRFFSNGIFIIFIMES